MAFVALVLLLLVGCVAASDDRRLYKCCPGGQVMSEEGCAVGNDTLFYNYELTVLNSDRTVNLSIPTLKHSFSLEYGITCEEGKIQMQPEDYPEDIHSVVEDGTLFLYQAGSVLQSHEFCLDIMADVLKTFRCLQQEDYSVDIKYAMYSSFLILSLPFLAGTFFVYASIRRLRNVHGKCLMSHVTSLFFAYLSLIIVHVCSNCVDNNICTSTAFIIYFSFLASFFWLNVMCLDIWWTFSGFRPMRGSVKEREHKKFIIYSLYCWGCPLIMLIVAMVMDLHPDIPDTYLKPGFGKRRCWFDEDNATLAYFLGPIAVLIICNILLFVLTAIQIRKLKKDTKILKKQESQRHDDEANNTQRFNLYLKLFLVMGVNWIMEVISWAFGGPEYLWYLTDIGNTLQGVLIFIIFVWKDRIRRLLMEKFCPKRAALNASTKSHGTTLTSTTRASTTRHSPNRNANMSVRSSNDAYRMKPLVTSSPSVRSDESDGP